MCAMPHDDVATASLLVDKEAGMADGTGKTALMRARLGCGSETAVSLLIDKEAGMTDLGGRTALMLAAARGFDKIVALLCAKEVGLLILLARRLSCILICAVVKKASPVMPRS
eukprot:gnl/Ergobibamus_cyprinoides/5993.p2 GENE.gnl/Ergobibamus_cyprinoides/5993~~gnl/Ergobibamus_cyprinoides/5993.p2  ORF type:complete len:113 (+),score=13.56 gnl/Ergobibamus_cyprinoides/5993:241-579(+)